MTTTFSIVPDSERDSSGFAEVFERQLLEAGCTKATEIKVADFVFVFDLPRRFSRNKQAVRRSRGKKILLRFEPSVVNPILYQSSTERLFDIVLNIGGKNHVGSEPAPLKWPYFPHPNPAKPKKSEVYSPEAMKNLSPPDGEFRPYKVSVVVSNKVSWSAPSNYGLRQKLILQRRNLNLSAFGMHWDETRWQRFQRSLRIYLFFLSQGFLPNPLHLMENLGFDQVMDVPAIINKFKVIAQSEFHLVIENSSAYVSEKLIDAMIGGAIPIYCGPKLTHYGIPDDCYIAFPDEPYDQVQLLQNLDSFDKNSIRMKIQNFLNSPNGLRTWMPESIAQSIISRCL